MKLLIIIFILAASALAADPPPGYYDGTEGLFGEDLKAVLNDIIDNHMTISYDAVWNALKETDKDPDNPENVILLYTGWSVTNTGYPTWNREHVWAQSHGNLGTSMGPGTDLHHLKPCDPGVNSSRGNKDFDYSSTPHPVAIGCYYDDDSWEPRDEVKGDVARMIFYMATRYEGEGGELDLEVVDAVNTAPAPEHGKLSALLEWNDFDPPDDFEMNRNDVIFENYQFNRNPFVDHPHFVNLIWQETTADFSAEPTQGYAPLLVQFTDLSTSASEIAEWHWDLNGDGEIDSYLQNPEFLYEEDGVYSISLYVQNDLGQENTITKEDFIQVGAANIPITIFADSFEEELSWTIVDLSSTYTWERTDNIVSSSRPNSVPDGEWYMYMNNYGSNGSADDWLISPPIDLSIFSDPSLSFYTWTKYSDAVAGLTPLISLDYPGFGNPYDYTWQNIEATLPETGSAEWFFSEEAGLQSFLGEVIHIAFQYQSTGAGASSSTAWAVDQVVVQGYDLTPAGYDIAIPVMELKNYPNPFNPSGAGRSHGTTISFEISNESFFAKNYGLTGENEQIELMIYNVKGQKVKTITFPNGSLGTSNGVVVWNGADENNQPVSSGIYYYKLNILESPIKKMLLLK